MVSVAGHAYCWDVVGDPAFAGRVTELGVDSVTLAATYHSTRAATPSHPRHQVIDARYAALYRPLRPAAWRGRRLRPLGPDWMDSADPYREAAGALRAASLSVTAWVVLAHNTRLGRAFGDIAVRNCFDERYPYALCPAYQEVRDFAATLAAEAVRDVGTDAVSLESCGQMGLAHLGHHEKTGDAWSPAAMRWLSVCCCPACQRAWVDRGLDPRLVIEALRAAVRAEAGDGPANPPSASISEAILAARQDAADALRAEVIASVRQTVPGVRVTLHAQADPWATGPSPGLTGRTPAGVDALLVPAWPTGPSSARAIRAAVTIGLPVQGYVTVLPPAQPSELVDHVRALVASGATGISLYHLGLAARPRQHLLRELSALARTLETT
jgi:hypothetical protein